MKTKILVLMVSILSLGMVSFVAAQIASDGDLNADVTYPWPNDATQGGVYAGCTITYNVLMAGDLDATGFSGTVITIANDGITFDGNGKTITAPAADQVISVGNSSTVLTNITLARVKFLGGVQCALRCEQLQYSLIEGLNTLGTTQNGFYLRNCRDLQIRNCIINKSQYGIYFHYDRPDANSGGNLVENCLVTDCAQAGIWGQGRPSESGDIYIGNDCSRSGYGIYTFWAKEVTGNNLSGCVTALGLHLYGNDWGLNFANMVTQNTFTGAVAGINIPQIVSGTSITDLDCRSMGIIDQVLNIGSWEIYPSDITLARIQFSASANWALCCSGFQNSLIEDVVVTGSGQDGIHLRNCQGMTIRKCNASGLRFGIYIHYDCPTANSGGNLVENCLFTDCAQAGIWGQGRPTESGDICIGNDCSRSGYGIYSFWANEISGNTLVACGTGLFLENAADVKIYHNNIFGSISFNMYSKESVELSYQNEGNYWGHSCENPPLFIPGTDSNSPEVIDNYPYALFNGWLDPQVTPGCPPYKNQPPVILVYRFQFNISN